ncbi:L10-interacting MYB domain-containing protein-like [Gossypium raimondii]|uniref:L10-interacting MYB domain-containing protein-like n=1 Tax=Gossypium raimondii TaxID=29730 RepID=UPI00227CA136|nr:L10-interacting MYB domain-containing protein-like [Gossypium raimondii]
MVKTRNFVEGDSSLATKAVWDDELTLIICELCVNEVNAGIGWCPTKKTVDATEEWWAAKIQENPDFKGFKKKGIEPRLNELMWQMFGGIVATGENARAPWSGVLPSGVPMGDDAPYEGFGDSDEHSNENEGIPPDEIEKLCESMASPRKSVNEIIFPHSQYTISNAMDALRALGDEIPKRDELYYFATKMFQIPVKREMFLNLDPDDRVWWLRREYAEQNPIASFSSLVATSSFPFQPYHQPPPPSAP